MAGRECLQVRQACRLVLSDGLTVTEAARIAGVAITSVRRALRRRKVAPLPAGRPATLQAKLPL